MSVRLRDYQEHFVQEVRVTYRSGVQAILLVAATGSGKCLGRGTPVLMFDGTIEAVENVHVGDLLMGPDSKPRRVLSLARGREQMYRVTPNKGDPYVVNESHILSLKITGLNGKSVTAPDGRALQGGDLCNISVRDYLRASSTFKHCAKGWRAAVDFKPNGKLPLPPYILGAWLGDGTTGKLSFTTSDTAIAREFERYARSVGMKFVVEQNSEWSVIVHLVSAGARYGRGGSPFGNALRDLGVFNEKRIPHSYKTASRKDRLELLAGLIDTDGYNGGKGFDLTLKSEALIDDVIFVARSLGFACYKRKISKKCHNNGVVGAYFKCHINGPVDQVPCRLQRKQAKPRQQKKDVLVTGIKVEPIGEDDYYGFEIDGDRLFMLGDFTVTHNTVVFSYIAKSAAALGRRVLILAHRDTLIKQASRKLSDYDVEHGIIMAGFTPNRFARVQVASVQTMVRRLAKKAHDHFDLIVIDEAHLSAAKSYRDILAAFPKARILGVTGSPARLDGKGLGKAAGGIYEQMVHGISIKELIEQGYLVRPVVFAPADRIDLSGVKKTGGDYEAQSLAEVMDKPKITGDAIAAWRKHCPGVPAVAWCANVTHAQHVAAEFNAASIPALALSGESTSDERERAMAALSSGKLKVITFAMLLVEGVDCPAIGAIIMLRPTMSLASYLQVIGRGLRPIYADGMPLDTVERRRAAIKAGPKGDRCFVLDHAGLTFKHGFADELREWSLDGIKKKNGGKKKEEAALNVQQCPSCFAVHEKAPVCPSCGHVYKGRGGPEHVDGELAEITPEMAESMKAWRAKALKKARTREQLEEIQQRMGYSASWVDLMLDRKKKAAEKYRRPEPPIEAYFDSF